MVEKLVETESVKKEEEKKKKKLEVEMKEEEKELMKKEEKRKEILGFEEVRTVAEKARRRLEKEESLKGKAEPPKGDEGEELSFERIVKELEEFLQCD